MRTVCYLLAGILATSVLPQTNSETRVHAREPVEQRDAPQADKPVVGLTAYVPTTTHVAGLGEGFVAVLEITNHSAVPLDILRRVYSEKVFELEVKPLDPAPRLEAPADDGAARVVIVAQTVYPNDVEGKGYSTSGKRARLEVLSCGPGETVFMKIQVHKAVFQLGRCKLLFTLRVGPAGAGRDVARSQEIPVEVIRADPRPVG